MSGAPASPAIIAAPFEFDCGTVPPDWIDRNGHVNVTRYLVASEMATSVLYQHLGLDDGMRARNGCGMFAAEHHIVYKAEMGKGDRVLVVSLLLDCNDKGIHFLNRILRSSDGVMAAAVENVELHVDLTLRRVVPFTPEVQLRLQAVCAAHARLGAHAAIGRAMTLRGKLRA